MKYSKSCIFLNGGCIFGLLKIKVMNDLRLYYAVFMNWQFKRLQELINFSRF
jgi:hypothetical protein